MTLGTAIESIENIYYYYYLFMSLPILLLVCVCVCACVCVQYSRTKLFLTRQLLMASEQAVQLQVTTIAASSLKQTYGHF